MCDGTVSEVYIVLRLVNRGMNRDPDLCLDLAFRGCPSGEACAVQPAGAGPTLRHKHQRDECKGLGLQPNAPPLEPPSARLSDLGEPPLARRELRLLMRQLS